MYRDYTILGQSYAISANQQPAFGDDTLHTYGEHYNDN